MDGTAWRHAAQSRAPISWPPLYTPNAGVVLDVIDKYVAEIDMLDSGDVIRVDQANCETVLPVRRSCAARRWPRVRA